MVTIELLANLDHHLYPPIRYSSYHSISGTGTPDTQGNTALVLSLAVVLA